MRHIASILLAIASALWLGGLVTLFLAAHAVFKAVPDRTVAGTATSAIFIAFAQYQLFVAATALVGAFLGYVVTRANIFVIIFALLGIATIGASFVRMHLIPHMEKLRTAGEGATPAFKKLHGYSMIAYTAMTALVLIVIAMLPFAARADKKELPTEAEY